MTPTNSGDEDAKRELSEGRTGRLRRRYAGRGKEGKTRLLDEFCEHYRYERKHAIKLLGEGLPKASGQMRTGAGV
jgi:hypothetical protein